MIEGTFGNGVPISSRSSLVRRSQLSCYVHPLTLPQDDFFVGIGDINAAFLPKRSLLDEIPISNPPSRGSEPTTTEESGKDEGGDSNDADEHTVDLVPLNIGKAQS